MTGKMFSIIAGVLCGTLAGGCHYYSVENHKLKAQSNVKPVVVEIVKETTKEPVMANNEVTEVYEQYTNLTNPKNDIWLLARCVEAEAGNQGYLGKCYVADVILNRVDSDAFPDNFTDVIFQDGQFEVVSNGTIWMYEPTEETWQAVWDEVCATAKMDSEIVFFRTKQFHLYGTPAFQYQDHYFNKLGGN